MEDFQIKNLRDKIDSENKQMIQHDRGYSREQDYKGYHIAIYRTGKYGHLCGYIFTKVEEGSEKYDVINEHFHGGITLHKNSVVGFDCNHKWDFNLKYYDTAMEIGNPYVTTPNEYVVYRTLAYVETCLKETVDALVEHHTS